MKHNEIKIQGRLIGRGNPSFIIGEVAQAHDGSLGLAHSYIDAIADAGADAVKFQTHIADAESSPDEPWRVQFSLQDKTRFDYWKRMEFSKDQWARIKNHAEQRDLIFISSPFSLEAADLLYSLDIAVWKIASGELTNPVLLNKLAQTELPHIISTGMGSLEEIDRIVNDLNSKNIPFAVLQCTSCYPCPPEKIGLNMLSFFQNRYNCPVGLSDHSGTIFPSLAAVSLGANIIEVHVTLNRHMVGPDVSSSVTFTELKMMVEGIRFIEKSLGNPIDKNKIFCELSPIREIFSKSIVLNKDLKKGSVLTKDDLTVKKPGTGIPAQEFERILGKKVKKELKTGVFLHLEDIED
jgi:N-acetylneuraminate synthase